MVIRDVDTWPRVCFSRQEAGLSPDPFYKPIIQSYQQQTEPIVSVNILFHVTEIATADNIPVLIDGQHSQDREDRFKLN